MKKITLISLAGFNDEPTREDAVIQAGTFQLRGKKSIRRRRLTLRPAENT